MTLQHVGTAVHRVKAALERRPEFGPHDDAPAVAQWEAGTRVVTRCSNGQEITTDTPKEIGGAGDQVTPGWLFRAAMASCAATSIAFAAAADGVELTALEVDASSRSDTRGLLGMSGSDGQTVFAGPFDVVLRVTIAANAMPPADLKALVEKCLGHSPIPSALKTATPFALHVNVTSV